MNAQQPQKAINPVTLFELKIGIDEEGRLYASTREQRTDGIFIGGDTTYLDAPPEGA